MVLGNTGYLACGTISGGPCDGDEFFGVGIYPVDNPEGCANSGKAGDVALVRILRISGKCTSKCSLGKSLVSFNPSVSNHGIGTIKRSNDSKQSKRGPNQPEAAKPKPVPTKTRNCKSLLG